MLRIETFCIRYGVLILTSTLLLTLSGVLVACVGSASNEETVEDIPIIESEPLYAIDTDNPAALVGDADYVFVGFVESMEGTEYRYPAEHYGENGELIKTSTPFTNYNVRVLKNIKGNLMLDTIPLQKFGGLTEDGKGLDLAGTDTLPQVEEVYIFVAYAQHDGSLLVGGEHSNLPIEVFSEKERNESLSISKEGNLIRDGDIIVSNNVSLLEKIEAASAYQWIVEGYQNETPRQRERSVSIYEAQDVG